MFLLLLLFSPSVAADSPIDCFFDQQKCQIERDILINTFPETTSVEECKLVCEDEINCRAFTYFGSNSFPIPNGCLLFSTCRDQQPCENCTTGSTQAQCTCSISYAGEVTSANFVDLFGGVQDELSCKSLCLSESRCDLYTYYDSDDVDQPRTCFLFTSLGLQTAARPCENCFTGSGQCRVNETCRAAVITNGTVTNAIFAEENSTVTLVANQKDCCVDLDVIAIGGGGNFLSGTGAGAGSGYVEAGKVRLPINSPVMQITVRPGGSPSKVEVGGEVVLEAAPGESPILNNEFDTGLGGDGYCGGGGSGGGSPRGGTDGGEGEDGSQGK